MDFVDSLASESQTPYERLGEMLGSGGAFRRRCSRFKTSSFGHFLLAPAGMKCDELIPIQAPATSSYYFFDPFDMSRVEEDAERLQ